MRMIHNDEVGLKQSQNIPNCFIWNCTFRNAQGRCSLRGSVVGDARHWRDQPFCAIPKQLQWQFLESLCGDKFVIQLAALHISKTCVR